MRTPVQRRYVVFVDWSDEGVEDTDEISVFACDEAEARAKASVKWAETVVPQWPECRIVSMTALTSSQMRNAHP